MGKISVFVLKGDTTGFLQNCKTTENKVKIGKVSPEFTEGKSIFHVTHRYLFGIIKRHKRYGFWVEGSPSLLTIQEGATRVLGSSWTYKELVDHIAKVVQLSAVKEKLFSDMRFYLLLILLMMLVAFRLYQFVRTGF